MEQSNINEKYQVMLKKLDNLYDKEEVLKKLYKQVKEDIELLEYLLMYQYNKDCREGIIKNKLSKWYLKKKKDLN